MDNIRKNTVAIILAGGRGKRMGGDVPKQYMDVCGKPLLYYTLKVFEESFIDKIIIVCGQDERSFVKNEIVDRYGFYKVVGITTGGKERYHSVYNGLCYIEDVLINDDLLNGKIYNSSMDAAAPIVFIHDGARPLVTEDILQRCYKDAVKYGSGVASVPSKDTVKIADEKGFAVATPRRDTVFMMQTPQTFDFNLILYAYRQLIEREDEIIRAGIAITDDAMVMENFTDKPVKLSMGSYENIKITTPEDLVFINNYISQYGY